MTTRTDDFPHFRPGSPPRFTARVDLGRSGMRGNTLIVRLVALAAWSIPLTLAAGEPTRFAATLPFRDCDGLICIQARIDGGALRTLALDTGNVVSTLPADTARSLGWHATPLSRAGRAIPGVRDGGSHEITLGRVRLDAHFVALERKLLGEHPPPADGTLAYTAFKDRIVQIDYPHHRLRISGPVASSAPPPAGGSLKQVTFGRHGPPVVVGAPFEVHGHTLRAQIDTMFTGTLLVYDAALGRLGLRKQGTPTFFGYTDGGVNLLAAPARPPGFAGRPLLGGRPPLYFVGTGANPVHQPDGLFEATAGNALFAHSVVTLDFHAMTLDVRPSG